MTVASFGAFGPAIGSVTRETSPAGAAGGRGGSAISPDSKQWNVFSRYIEDGGRGSGMICSVKSTKPKWDGAGKNIGHQGSHGGVN